MTSEVELRVRLRAVLDRKVLVGSERDVPFDAPLGEEGIGLDSLALVQFLTAVEQELGAEFPFAVWSDVAHLSLDDCAAALAADA
jgi:acyl carrier protein